MIWSNMPYNIYNAYWTCTVFCPEIDFWSLDWCKQLSTWERFNYDSRCQEKPVPGLQQTGSFSLLAGIFHPASMLDTSHLKQWEQMLQTHRKRWLAPKCAGVPRPQDALQISPLFSGFWEGSIWLCFVKCWRNWDILALCSIKYPPLVTYPFLKICSLKRSNCDKTQWIFHSSTRHTRLYHDISVHCSIMVCWQKQTLCFWLQIQCRCRSSYEVCVQVRNLLLQNCMPSLSIQSLCNCSSMALNTISLVTIFKFVSLVSTSFLNFKLNT